MPRVGLFQIRQTATLNPMGCSRPRRRYPTQSRRHLTQLARVAQRMQITHQGNGENVGSCRPQQYGSLNLVTFDPVALIHKSNAVPVNGMGNFMT